MAEDLPGQPPAPPRETKAQPHVRKTQSKTPSAGEGITTDETGKLPVQVRAQSIVLHDEDPAFAKIGQLWHRTDTHQLSLQEDQTTVIRYGNPVWEDVGTSGGVGGGTTTVGLQFDTEPQDGDWLFIHTTGEMPDRGQFGILLLDDGYGYGIKLDSNWHIDLVASNAINITASNITSNATGAYQVTSSSGVVNLTSSSDMTLEALNGLVRIKADSNAIRLDAHGGSTSLILDTGSGLWDALGGGCSLRSQNTSSANIEIAAGPNGSQLSRIFIPGTGGIFGGFPHSGVFVDLFSWGELFEVRNGSSSATLFQVWANGTIHGKTGGSIIWDL